MDGSQKTLHWIKESSHRRVHTIQFHLYKRLGKANLIYSNEKKIGVCLGPRVGGAGNRLEMSTKETFGWWKCSVSWLCWWLHGYEHLSQLALYI